MTQKEATLASPFDRYLEPQENILWIEHQEWIKDWRLTRGRKIAWGMMLILFLLLMVMIHVLFGENALLVYCILGVQICVGVLLKASYIFSHLSPNPPYFHCWYAVTNRRLLYAFKGCVYGLPLLEIEKISKVCEAHGRGRLDFERSGKGIRFVDIHEVDAVHQLVLEQQRFLQRMASAQP